ncbi:MAG: glycosyltransferase family 39 protein, partial [Candidatus Omnitrophota bacterium]|nr:glycosyltransferase family 39 protein [Candidatus Omnitrophota bacterium]
MKTLLLKLFIFIFCIFLFSFGIQNISSEFKGDENFYFESARQMLETGDVITPRYMGEERFQKPIFFYWFILLSFKIFGVSWFAARLPSIVFGALCALLIFAISRLFFEDKRIGLFAALLSAVTPLYYRYARLAVPDMALLFFMTLALYCFVKFYKNKKGRKSLLLFFSAAAFAVLIKGPVGLILPLLIVTVFCLFKKEKIRFRAGDIVAGIVIFVLLTAPWFYLMHRIHGGEYISHVCGREIAQRLGHGYGGFLIAGYFKGFIFYASALITKFLPYSLFMPLAFMGSFSILSGRFPEKRTDTERTAHLFLILWFTAVFLFFTFIAERRTHYLLTLVPPVSILLGVIFNKAISDRVFCSNLKFKLPYLL